MLIWRCDKETGNWRPDALQPDTAYYLASGVMLYPLAHSRCALLARTCLFVNGRPALPFHMLSDRDEIRFGQETAYFSLDSVSEVVAFPAAGNQGLTCGRCHVPIPEGTPAVRCPRCGAWHHERDELPCWTYTETCSACQQPTRGFSWAPEALTRRGRSAGTPRASEREPEHEAAR